MQNLMSSSGKQFDCCIVLALAAVHCVCVWHKRLLPWVGGLGCEPHRQTPTPVLLGKECVRPFLDKDGWKACMCLLSVVIVTSMQGMGLSGEAPEKCQISTYITINCNIKLQYTNYDHEEYFT